MRAWILIAAVAACGGNSSKRNSDAPVTLIDGPVDSRVIDSPADAHADAPRDSSVVLIDAPRDSGGSAVCNVLAQTGCASGEKCTWIIDQADMTSSVGHIGCAPNGTMATGAACTRNTPGATGYDDCLQGNYCFGPDTGGAGTCKAICDTQGGSPACGSSFACVTYDGLFGSSGQPVAAGVCDPRCDPLADNNFLGSNGNNRTGTTCGSAGSAAGSGFLYSKGCYGLPDGAFGPTQWTCDGQFNYSRVHRTACDTTMHAGDLATCAPSTVQVYVNGCASGYEPMFQDAEGVTQIDCVAMCAPVSCYNTGSGSAIGSATCGTGSGSNITGAAPHQCKTVDLQSASFNQLDPTTAWSSAAPTVNNGEQCLYSWIFEFDSSSNFVMSTTSDTVGFCVDHSKYAYDPTGGANNTTTWPRCDYIGLGSGGYGVGAGDFDASYFGCIDTTTARAHGILTFAGKPKVFKHVDLRMPYHATVRR